LHPGPAVVRRELAISTAVDLASLAALALVVLALTPAAALVPAALLVGFWRRRIRAGRERRAGELLFGGAVALLAAAALAGAIGRRPVPEGESLEAAHRAWLAQLGERAAAAASSVAGLTADDAGRRAAFTVLGRAAAGERDLTFLLLDSDDAPFAWGGRGLLHDLVPESLPARGFAARRSATAATLLAVQPVTGTRGWRLVAGESRELAGPPPIPVRSLEGIEGGRWRLAGGTEADDWTLAWSRPARSRSPVWADRLARAAVVTFAVGLWVIAVLRASGRWLLSGTVLPRRHPAIAALLPAAAAPAIACSGLIGPGRTSLALLVAGLIGAAGWLAARRGRSSPGSLLPAAAVGPALALFAAHASGLPELGGSIVGAVAAVSWRLAAVAFAFGAIRFGSAAPEPGSPAAWGWGAALLAVSGGAAADLPVLAGVLVAAAGLAAALAARRTAPAAASSQAAILLLSALVAGSAWSAGERSRAVEHAGRAVPTLLPPEAGVLDEVAAAVDAGLATVDLGALLPAAGPPTETGDLAFALWRDSALARFDAISALTVESAGRESSFSWGLPLDASGRPDFAPERWVDLARVTWPDARIDGERSLAAPDGVAWTVRWWLVPRAGFGAGGADAGEIAAGLLRGGGAERRPYGLPPAARWATWDREGRVQGSSWEQRTPAPEALPAPGIVARVETPEGAARTVTRRGPAGVAAVFVPRLDAVTALERAGSVAAGGLLPIAVLALAGVAAALPRSAVRDLVRRALRSYSKRLLIVYALLLLVPTALLYVLLSSTLERRVEREQEVAARSALRSAQRVLGEYVLTLAPGFGVGTAIDDALLELLARVVQHEVHLYWDSEVYASSKRDLFAAGLLPRRLPGEVQERLALAGDAVAVRTSRAGAVEYLELYSPLEVPGESAREANLVLSMPLLAQQEEALAEADRLRRRVLLVSIALLVALAATGSVLARRFTRPIEEIVAGTRRIAGGAAALGFRPEEAELEALAEAIDRMAGRIAQGRERLIAEKRLVESVVESVTAAVAAVDAAGRVLVANRVARDLLGAEPGRPLTETLAGRPGLAEVSALLAGPQGVALRTGVRLHEHGGEGHDWTIVRLPLAEAGDATALIVVEDVTEIVRARRLEAWAEMARLIAHEIKNPLTPIRLSAEHLREAWQRDRAHFEGVFDRCTDNILRQVEELRSIASDFSAYAQIPRIERQEGDLVAAVAAVAEAYRAAPPPGVEVRFRAGCEQLAASFDPKLLPRAVRNLIENAIRASSERGSVEVTVEQRDGVAEIAVTDRGPGVPPDQLGRILEPYFSTHASGTGLGLPIAARIAEEHGGALLARNRPIGGFEVVVTIPLS
jgi:nitrogen fixation/metabolism regulation signal transduction histidine kinase